MITLRKSSDRGAAEHGWLHAKHSFSFSEYHDPAHMGFRSLRVINEDKVEPKMGFPTHGHKDMEIITYVIEGALEHKDSMGNGSIIRPGEVQYMSAGSGVRHSEFNHNAKEPVHLLQIWILPNAGGLMPRYAQTAFSEADRLNKLCPVVRPDSSIEKPDAGDHNEAIAIRQDAKIFTSLLENGKTLEYSPKANRGQWIQVVRGEITVNGQTLGPGDGAAIEGEKQLRFEGKSSKGPTEFLLFDLG